MELKDSVKDLLGEINRVLEDNDGRISEEFVKNYAKKCNYEYGKVGDSARVCVLTTTTGYKIVGHALLLDPSNDVASIGNGYAKENCINGLWQFLGGLAKMIS